MRNRKKYNPTRNVDIGKRVAQGIHHQGMVHGFLERRGVGCCLPDQDFGDDIEQWTRKDIDIVTNDGKVIEVKSRSSTCVFTNPGDFPFDDVFVDTVAGWQRKEVKPYAYVFVSQDTGAMLWVPGDTHDKWSKRQVYDSFLKYKTWTYCADRELLRDIDELVQCLLEEGYDPERGVIQEGSGESEETP